ncbi:hypothetical protein BaRGS_00039211, partial [Batillaria attramentaria]
MLVLILPRLHTKCRPETETAGKLKRTLTFYKASLDLWNNYVAALNILHRSTVRILLRAGGAIHKDAYLGKDSQSFPGKEQNDTSTEITVNGNVLAPSDFEAKQNPDVAVGSALS